MFDIEVQKEHDLIISNKLIPYIKKGMNCVLFDYFYDVSIISLDKIKVSFNNKSSYLLFYNSIEVIFYNLILDFSLDYLSLMSSKESNKLEIIRDIYKNKHMCVKYINLKKCLTFQFFINQEIHNVSIDNFKYLESNIDNNKDCQLLLNILEHLVNFLEEHVIVNIIFKRVIKNV